MKGIVFRIVTVLVILTSINNYICAINAEGYIITENADTIHGTIKLHEFDQMTGGYIINGFDIKSLNYKVSFKGNGDKRYKLLLPGKISGFGFSYDSIEYTFKSFLINYKSIFNNEENIYRFLQLVHQGNVQLYQNTICIQIPSNFPVNTEYMTEYEFFLYDKPNGLWKVQMNKQIKTIPDLLRQFNFDAEFIKEVPENTNFEDIKVVLHMYEEWLLAHSPILI